MKLTLNNVGSLIDATTAANTINSNSAAIVTAIENTLSRDGTIPNKMAANIDINSNRILNLPAPVNAFEPLRLQDLNDFVGGGTVTNIPIGGNTKDKLTKLSNTNYDIGWVSTAGDIVAGTNINTTGTTPVTISTVTNPTFVSPSITTPTGIVKADVGLSNVDNTSDVTKWAATKTLTNTTYDTAGTGNVLKVNGASITNTTGASAFLVLANSPLITSGILNTNVLFNGISSGQLTIVPQSVASGTLTLPNGTDTLVGRATVDTLTNKTLTAPVMTSPVLGTPASGVATNLTGTASGLTAGNVITNATLTGVITSSGNATSIASQTGTGTKFVVDTSPTLAGTPLTTTAAVDTNTTQIASTAFVLAQAGSATPVVDGTGTVGTSTRFARQDHVHPTDTTRAPLASPTFTGTVTIPSGATLATPTTLVATNATGTASGLTAGNVTTNANLTGDVTSVGNATTFTGKVGGALGQIPGTLTNDSATTGNVGEIISSTIVSGSAVSLTNNTSANLTSLSLTAGDWDVWLEMSFTGNVSTLVQYIAGSINNASATMTLTPGQFFQVSCANLAAFNTGFNVTSCNVGPLRVSLSGTTTYFGIANVGFTVSTASVYGIMRARRVR